MTSSLFIRLRSALTVLLAAGLLAACGADKGTDSHILAVDIDRSTSCALDGMLLADYPGPKAQIHYDSIVQPDFFCDTVEMFSIYLKPEQARRVSAMYVQDMAKADWENPKGHWIDARTATYVHGSRRTGSMGPTIASFASADDARKFAASEGGKVLRFDEVTPDMVILDGGALHDKRM
ncbi:nitrous oxide reductase accessory protein NosL [Azoarcus sp. L1K30]|uniref:nitrous oxide reductase accessory protein NosL n=1 Tax=Azoarcus sp. L1K30 TaxID=2820277 RepID=UPI001B82188F|nr:nitrous oxide reductase accessory protein NosL [Azoarcus sp. L1K30]MBR0568177.1 nitrous oxide reductase accessory protein NosL [Azoarcus sp. L1K30]